MNLLTHDIDAANGGLHIYFLSNASGTYNLWRGEYNPDGISNITQLTFYSDHYIQIFDISEAADKIAFTLFPNGGHRGDIYISDMDMQNPQLIPNQPSQKAANGLSFSPDGNSIVFSLGASANTSNDLIVSIINVDGTDYQQIINTNQPRGIATHKLSINWTEYGLFIGDTEQWSSYSTKFEIFRYNFQTFTNLTNTVTIGENNPIISPNGERIVYQTRQTGSPNKYGIGVMNANGTNQTNIIPLTTGIGYMPGDWLNDNTIIYYSSIDGTNDIWQMNSDGTNQVKLTNISNSSQIRPKVVASAIILAHFSASSRTLNVNETVQFFDHSIGTPPPDHWTWNFGDGTMVSNLQNPSHIYSQSGCYNVSLTVTNPIGWQDTLVKMGYINVDIINEGITLQIIKTDPDGPPYLERAGYYYTIRKKKFGIWRYEEILVDTFSITNGVVTINKFPSQDDMQAGTELISYFNNNLLFFDATENYRGHIYFEYNPEKESIYKREAFIIFHNDDEICADGAFPYDKDHHENDRLWKYYIQYEYPVSMLMPPNNSFASSYNKEPLLFIHGWEGKFNLKKNPNALEELNETSYWFTIPSDFDNHPQYDTWQYYYPYNSAHKHLAICLKYALDTLKCHYVNKKIKIVTHSMGGLVTLRFLTQFPSDSYNNVDKVLFNAPPAHGSLGANLFYKKRKLEFLIDYDCNAPSVRDMKLGSDALRDIYSNPLPDLNGSGGVSDDYFVLLGTNYRYYLSDLYYQSYINSIIPQQPHFCLHNEAYGHHDGIVSISSGSLLDKGVGFATFNGNHDDAVHMQSFKRGDLSNQNIGDRNFLPELITSYFSNNYPIFIDYLISNDHIPAIVDHEKNVIKPFGQTLHNLNTDSIVKYQKGIITLEFSQAPGNRTFYTYYNAQNNVLTLRERKMTSNGEIEFGLFIKNTSSFGGRRYYFNHTSHSNELIYAGNALEISQDSILLIVWDKHQIITMKVIPFKYCETILETIELASSRNFVLEQNHTDTKQRLIIPVGGTAPDSVLTSFYIDDQAGLIDFRLSFIEPVIYNFPVHLKLKLPDGSIVDSTYQGAIYQNDFSHGKLSMEIPNPIPGQWFLWLESEYPGSDTISYFAVAFIQSEIYAHIPDSVVNIPTETEYTLKCELNVEDIDLISDFEVIATIFRPDSGEVLLEISESALETDSSLIFSLEYDFNISGEYLVKYNINGVYNNYNFERCLYQVIDAVDTIPIFHIPDIVLHQREPQKLLNLTSYTYNIDNYDTIYFSFEVIASSLDSTVFSATLDSLALNSYLKTNLSDTGMVLIQYTCHHDDKIVSDTVSIRVLLPEIQFVECQIYDSVISNNDELIIQYSIKNSGNIDGGIYNVKYLLSQDSVIHASDYVIGEKSILFHNILEEMEIVDTIQIPIIARAGEHYMLVMIDIDNQLTELDETNNLEVNTIVLNPSPEPPEIISAIAGNELVQLIWTSVDDNIAGHIIHYGIDTLGILEKIYVLNGDTSYTVTGLNKNTDYYFAVSAYRYIVSQSGLSNYAAATPYGPELSIVPSDLSFGNVQLNECLTLSYQISGNNLKDDIVITAPDCFFVSTNEEIGFENMTTVTHIDGIACQPIYVKFCPSEIQEYSGNITNTSSGATPLNVFVTGTGIHLVTPPTLTLQNITISSGQSECFNATQTITVAGNGTTFIIQNGGDATLIAGQSIFFMPGTMVYQGGEMLAYITTNGLYCGAQQSAIVSAGQPAPPEEEQTTPDRVEKDFVLYPNPTTGLFTLQFKPESGPQDGIVQIFNMNGARIYAAEIHQVQQHVMNISLENPGIYVVQVIRGELSETSKIVKR